MRSLAQKFLVVAICMICSLGAPTAQAQYTVKSQEDSAREVREEIIAWVDKSSTAIREAEQAENAGRNSDACVSYHSAIARAEKAIDAHIGYSGNMGVSYRDMSDSIDNLRRWIKTIESSASRVCGKPDRGSSSTYSPNTSQIPERQLPQIEKDIKESNRLTGIARHYFFDVDKKVDGCASSLMALTYTINALKQNSDNLEGIKPLRENIATIRQWSESHKCPSDKPHLVLQMKANEAEANARITFWQAWAAQESNDLIEACARFKRAASGFTEAKGLNAKLRTVAGHEALNTTLIDEKEKSLDLNIYNSNTHVATYCPKEIASPPKPEAVTPVATKTEVPAPAIKSKAKAKRIKPKAH